MKNNKYIIKLGKIVPLIILSVFVTSIGRAQTYNIDTDGGAIGGGTTINTCGGTISDGVGDYAVGTQRQVLAVLYSIAAAVGVLDAGDGLDENGEVGGVGGRLHFFLTGLTG